MLLIGHYMYGLIGFCINGNKSVPQEKLDVSHVSVLAYKTNYETQEHPAASYFAEGRQKDHSSMRDMHSQSHARN